MLVVYTNKLHRVFTFTGIRMLRRMYPTTTILEASSTGPIILIFTNSKVLLLFVLIYLITLLL